eukprot:4556366-Heterocapsa_arctica.AAC.1
MVKDRAVYVAVESSPEMRAKNRVIGQASRLLEDRLADQNIVTIDFRASIIYHTGANNEVEDYTA